MSNGTRYDVLAVREYEDSSGNKKTAWTRIGVAWPLDGGGLTCTLDALPISGRLVIKKHEPKDEHDKRDKRSDF